MLIKKLGAVALVCLSLTSCKKDENVGDVSLGFLTLNDIKIKSLVDPKVPGVTCHIASVEANFSFADPSENSISCRQTGPITPLMLKNIDRSKNGEIVFSKSKSILFKTMHVRRIFDPKNQTLLYLAYTTKETRGSFKHSLSTVPLWNTQAYVSTSKE